MTTFYNIHYQTKPAVSTSKRSDTSDDLDAFLSPSNSEVRFAFPPDLVSASSFDSSSTAEDQRRNKNEQSQEHSTALVPYYAKPDQPEKITSTLSRSVCASSTTFATTPLHKLIRVSRSNNPFGADAIHPKKKSMKKQRKRKTAAGAIGGMVVGGLALGPAGVFFGAAAGAVATNKICKARERRAQRKYEQENFQQAADQSNVHRATFA